MIDRPPAPGAAEAAHDLVGDEQDAVAVTDLAYALEVAVGRDEDAVRAHHRLEDEAGDGVAALVHDHVLELLQGSLDGLGLGPAPLVRVGRADDAGHAGLGGPAARVAGGGDDLAGGTVVGTVARQDLLAPRVLAGQLDGVLVGLGTAVREEDDVEVAGRQLRQLAGRGERAARGP